MKTAVGDGRLGLSIQVIRVFQILRGETESYFDRVLLRQTAEKFQYISILFQISITMKQKLPGSQKSANYPLKLLIAYFELNW